MPTQFYQTENAKETIAIIRGRDGSISIGIARAGKNDYEKGRVTVEEGMKVAEGRAKKAKAVKKALVKKNYLRGIYAERVKDIST